MRAALKLSDNCFAAGLSAGITVALVGATLAGSIGAALAACKPNHFRAPYFIKTMGECGFNSESLSFRGTPMQQAMCLMRGMDATRNLAPMLASLPPGLAKRIGESTGLPSRETLSKYLSKLDLEWDLAMYLWEPVSRARDNDPDAPTAKYFVIHDTSGPNYGHHAFPEDIDTNAKINNLKRFICSDEWGKAHVVINRMGDILVNHDFSTPWRETKFEQAAEFGGALKGLFVHTEMIQPRRAGRRGGDGHSPDPAFTPAQYDRLALVYTVVSVRAGRWLIPAFHAALDADIHNGHDDPLNFKIDSFADSLDRLMEQLQSAGQPQASNATTASDAQADVGPAEHEGFWVDAMWGTPHKTPVAVAATTEADSASQPDGRAVSDQPAPPQAGVDGVPATFNAAAAPVGPPAMIDKPPAARPQTVDEPARHEPARHEPAAHPSAHEKIAEREIRPPHQEKSAEACTMLPVKGSRHRLCELAAAGAQKHREEHTKPALRSAERDEPPRGDAPRHNGPAPRQRRDAGALSRHRRS